ncbi:MAG: ferritin-like domain-containing protein [Gammaproteobacteria bacterium]
MSPTPPETNPITLTRQRWTLEDTPWQTIQRKVVVNEEELFYLITTASFVKAVTGLYAHNLVRYFSADADITNWLEQHWQQEELQHGLALKCYVQAVWPEFDWDSAYEYFFKEFATSCREGVLGPCRSLEMASRCVVEIATASYYAALSGLTKEPVLSLLAGRISEDEVRHYQHFYRYFSRYRQVENTSRGQVLQAMWRRLKLLDGGDSIIVMKHVYGACHPYEPFNGRVCRQLQKRCRRVMARYFPREMVAKMVLKPLDLGRRTQQMASPILGRVAQKFVT